MLDSYETTTLYHFRESSTRKVVVSGMLASSFGRQKGEIMQDALSADSLSFKSRRRHPSMMQAMR